MDTLAQPYSPCLFGLPKIERQSAFGLMGFFSSTPNLHVLWLNAVCAYTASSLTLGTM